MPRHSYLIAVLLAVALLLGLGCEDRGLNLPTEAPYDGAWGSFPLSDHSYDSLLTLQLLNTNELWLGATYIPKVSMSPAFGGTDQPVPTLILLPPQDGDKFYYFQRGLLELAQELIATGEIEPMVIHCPANATAFGGFWYGDSYAAGRADAIIGDRMLNDYLFTRIPATVSTQKSQVGIGGVGMGAYGAFRAALKHPESFGSVSGVDGPLDFDGAGNTGLRSLFSAALAEQSTLTKYNILDTVTGSPTFGQPLDTFSFHAFDSGDGYISLPLSRLFIGGSIAFSLHQQRVTWDYDASAPLYTGERGVILSVDSIITDSSTMIDSIQGYGNAVWAYHLPFDSTGAVADTIWPYWMRNNLDSMYVAAGTPFNGMDIWVGDNPDAKWNYGEMTAQWINFLDAMKGAGGFNLQVHQYDSFSDNPVTGDEYVYDLLRQMLIFHSNSFKK